jgi:LacI family transcriptional regulator
MLLRLIREPDSGPLTHLMEAELLIGRSTGPAP